MANANDATAEGAGVALNKMIKASLPAVVLRWGTRLRFPYLFLLTAVLFIANVLIPDAIPFADEVLIGLVTLLLANLKKKPGENPQHESPDQQ